MKKLLIATHNAAKLDYFRRLFSDFDLELLTLADLGIQAVSPEDGNNEEDNALQKARFYAQKSGVATMSDDAGMYIDALNGEPGVQSRRWNGKFPDDITDEEWLGHFMDLMKDVPMERRTGHFKITRAIVMPDGQEYALHWRRDFIVNQEPNWDNYEIGWPMSTVYIEKAFGKPWTKMDWAERLYYEKENLEKLKEIFSKLN